MDKIPVGTIVAMKSERTFRDELRVPFLVSRGQRVAILKSLDAGNDELYLAEIGKNSVIIDREWVSLVGPCEKCNLLFELYEQTEKCPRDYWLMTEIFTWLHDGDVCPLAFGDHPTQIADLYKPKMDEGERLVMALEVLEDNGMLEEANMLRVRAAAARNMPDAGGVIDCSQLTGKDS